MRINFRIIWLALPLVFGACSDSSDADTRPATETISVSVGSGPKIDIESEDKSRTQLGEDGVSVKWASDDQIALWAVNSRSETVFSKQAFKLYHYNTDYNTAKFRGDIPQMPADTYTYYAVSPVPSESDGTQATYLIPDVQDGGFNGDWDVMVADPVKAPALEKNDTGETVQGEAVGKITLTAPEGSLFDNGTNVRQFTPDAEGKYTMVLKPSWTDNLSGKAVTVQYESESAVVSNTLTMPQITEFGNNDITLSVPYLLAEDFSNIIQFDYDCNVGTGTSSSSAGNKDAHLLSDKGAIGWTAARVGGETGKCIRSSCRFEGGGAGKASSYARYPGRIDSPPVSGIKSGKTVRVRVSFDYVGGQDSWMMDSNKNKGGTYGNPTFNYGYTTNSGQPNGGDNLENPVEAEDIALETDKSWNTPLSNWNTKTFLADFNSAHRISWKVNVNRIGNVSSWTGIFGANGNHYLYLDNIKVSIVNE